MYVVVNIENLKLYEPTLIMNTEEVPTVENFSTDYLDKLPEDIILERRTRASR